jgi:hypothetical protein
MEGGKPKRQNQTWGVIYFVVVSQTWFFENTKKNVLQK